MNSTFKFQNSKFKFQNSKSSQLRSWNFKIQNLTPELEFEISKFKISLRS